MPAGATLGLACDNNSLYAFGSGAAPAMPRGVLYQRLQHPDGSTPLVRVRSFDLFAGKIYVVAEFGDGTLFHFYDGVRVTDWIDARARASFRVTGGGLQPATRASCQFTVTSGSASIVNTIGDITLGGVSILGAPVQHTGNNATTAAAVAAQINTFVSSPDYTAAAVGAVVTITAAATGPAANGLTPVLVLTGDVLVAGITSMTGGAVAANSQLADLQVNGVSILAGPVDWTTDNATTAQLIVDSINSYASSPDYVATVTDDKVNILTALPNAASNGYAVTFTLLRNFTVAPTNPTLAGGADLVDNTTFQSGSFAKTILSKVYVTAAQFLNFSGILTPTGFASTNTGAGFVDMSAQASGAEKLTAVAKYQKWIAVFAERVTQIWYVDPDPAQNAQQQTLNNTGTTSPRSVTQFGDSDLFYLAASGVRSLRARDASNAASTNDVGVPIDTLIVEKLATLTGVQKSEIGGLIEPTSGRFWLVFPDLIAVFSLFEGSKISAWSTYTPSVNGVEFSIDDYTVFRDKVFLRSGDMVYCFGGLGATVSYDNTSPELWLPYLDAGTPAEKKQFRSIDVACEGSWVVSAGHNLNDRSASDKIATISETTYGLDSIPHEVEYTHISLRFKGTGRGPKKISAAAVKFDGDT
ncbi:hypothetical protein [Bradyrhizobium sp.]|uniref:hypothetical protein n=1 Tax=Bradyrhizobium sp. TaxID=376 RepID=UPI002DDD0896|nr:hypothetical protein [Bradyrhizobium sp.]